MFINDNLIKFSHGYVVKRILEEMKNLNIRTLNIMRNPFLKKQPLLEKAFAYSLYKKSLKILNNKSTDLFVVDEDFNPEDVLGEIEFVDSDPDD